MSWVGSFLKWRREAAERRAQRRLRRKHVTMPRELLTGSDVGTKPDSRSSIQQFRRIVGPRTNRPFASTRRTR